MTQFIFSRVGHILTFRVFPKESKVMVTLVGTTPRLLMTNPKTVVRFTLENMAEVPVLFLLLVSRMLV